MRREAATLESLAVRVLVISFQSEAAARAYVAETGLPWPLLLDPSRVLYRAYGMERGRLHDIWNWATVLTYARLLARGARLRPPAGDVYQLGGDVVIDPAGGVRLHRVGAGPADRPPVQALLSVIRRGKG